MVSNSPNWGYSPPKWPNFMAYKWGVDPNHLLIRMILQVGWLALILTNLIPPKHPALLCDKLGDPMRDPFWWLVGDQSKGPPKCFKVGFGNTG